MKILVTGANGFVGSVLCKDLLDADFSIKAIMRNPAPDSQEEESIEWLQIPQIDGDTDWSEVKLKEVDVIIHLASRVHVIQENESNPKEAFFKTNYEGTKHLAQEAVKAGVKHFVFISSAHIHGHVSGDKAFSENSQAQPHTDYAKSKWAAEEALHEIYQGKTKQSLTIIRPPLVYGAGVGANFEKLLWLVDKQIPLPLKKCENARSFIYVKNLTDFIVKLVKSQPTHHETFLISDGDDQSTPVLLSKLAEMMEKKPLLFPVKIEWVKKLSHYFSKENTYNSLCENLQLDISKAQTSFDWKAPFTLEYGLKETVDHYQKEQTESE